MLCQQDELLHHSQCQVDCVVLCRGGLILYRTVVEAKALQNGAELNVTKPVHDYARVSSMCSIHSMHSGQSTHSMHSM